jgi:hypothetical protein
MKRKLSFLSLIPLLAVLVSASGTSASGSHQLSRSSELVSPLSTAFTYQGRLEDANGPVSNTCDFKFGLFGSPRDSDQLGSTLLREGVLVADGYFTVADLDFGAAVFQGEARWLGIAVRCPSGTGTFESLSPRQALTAAPYALYALSAGSAPWSGLTGVPAGFADGVDDGSSYTAGEGLTLSGTQFSVDTSLIQARVGEVCPSGSAIRAVNQDGTVTCQGVSGTAGGDITAVWTGDGLFGGNDVGDITLEVDTDYLQRRVDSSCPAGSAIRVINPDGTVSCETDSDTTYSAGSGLTLNGLNGTQFSVDNATTQARVGGTCSPGSSIRIINADGTVSCETDNNTTTFWGLSGSSGTNPASNYLGTSDNQPLVLRVNATQALRLEPTSGTPNLVGGYSGNSVTEGVYGAVIAGGGESGEVNRVTDIYGTVGGGRNNQAGKTIGVIGFSSFATVSGGLENTASGLVATVSGGYDNTASGNYATVGGGIGNDASSLASTVGGGDHNTASGYAATVSGGYDNTASGIYATVPGGRDNDAVGDYSFAVGQRARALSSGAFVWADSNYFDFDSIGSNTFSARATGGYNLVAGINTSGGTTWHCIFYNGTSWACSSDRHQKENFQAVDGRAVLEKVSQLPVLYWNAKGTDPAVKHLGPMAQDFYAAFGLGDDDTRIATIDLDGVSLAAIQGLYQLSLEKDARIAALEGRLEGQQGHIEALEARLAALERAGQPGQAGGSPALGYLPYLGFAALGFGLTWRSRKRGGER